MKPAYHTLKSFHASSNDWHPDYISTEKIYESIGQNLNRLIEQNPAYENSCGVRMSIALLRAGLPIRGRMRIKEGDQRDKFVEPGAKLLADQLMTLWGKPEIFNKPEQALEALREQKGVIFFSKITGYGGGHIDLIEAINATSVCHSQCYFNCQEIWFWCLN